MTQTPMEAQQHEYRQHIRWYHSVVAYLLNRCEGLPLAITDLIREANQERYNKFGPPQEKMPFEKERSES